MLSFLSDFEECAFRCCLRVRFVPGAFSFGATTAQCERLVLTEFKQSHRNWQMFEGHHTKSAELFRSVLDLLRREVKGCLCFQDVRLCFPVLPFHARALADAGRAARQRVLLGGNGWSQRLSSESHGSDDLDPGWTPAHCDNMPLDQVAKRWTRTLCSAMQCRRVPVT